MRLRPLSRPRNSAFTSAADSRTFADLPLFIMFFRIRPTRLITLALLAAAPVFSAATPVDDAEAQRLYDRANDFVANIAEDGYSYSYIQFHWKRAQANLDRILEVYPDTPVGHAVKSGQLKLGTYDLPYFRERVLYRLEEKRLAASDYVYCAVFLTNIDDQRWDRARADAVLKIIEVLARQKRWSEALQFPILDKYRLEKWSAIFRVAARFEQDDLVKELLANTRKAELPFIHAILGEALALRGRPRSEIAKLLDLDPSDGVKLAVLGGMAQREVQIQRAAQLRIPTKNIRLADDSLKRPEVRDDVIAVAKTFFPKGSATAEEILAAYRAALGAKPTASASAAVHLAYLEYLSAAERVDEFNGYLTEPALSGDARRACELKVIELFAFAGRLADSERYRAPYVAAGGAFSDAAALAQFRGQINSIEAPLIVREKTLAAVPIQDPCVLAQAIMEWRLTPNLAQRGAAPYDAVVRRFAPGFANIPPVKSKKVGDAASSLKPY